MDTSVRLNRVANECQWSALAIDHRRESRLNRVGSMALTCELSGGDRPSALSGDSFAVIWGDTGIAMVYVSINPGPNDSDVSW